METLKKQLVSGIISLIVSFIIVFITLRSEAWGRKADKIEVYRIEQEVKKDINRMDKDLYDFKQENTQFKRDLNQKLDDHQKQIIEILKAKK